MADCLCGSQKNYSACCEAYLTDKQRPDTPLALMRSRYTAYCLANIDYIQNTMRGKALLDFDVINAKRWATRVNWIKLTILDTSMETQHKGYVEFIATFVDDQVLESIHEKSEFIHEEGRWYYVDGVQIPSLDTTRRLLSRHSLCPCGSHRKFKNCHKKL